MAGQHATPYVFVSYASVDREQVLVIVEALRGVGVPVWLDQQGIAGGANYGMEIAQAIAGCAAFVLMCSAASLASRNVKQEIALAWEHERHYVPLLLEAVTIPIDLQYWLTAAQRIEVLDRPEGAWLPVVLAALQLLGITPVSQQEEIQLAGRERELSLLREKLAATREGKGGLVLIGGEAGIGKTTLAEAVLREAERAGSVVLEGHCFDLAETPPYGLWIDLFARYAPSPSSPTLPEAFARRGTVGSVANQMTLFVQVQEFLAALGEQQPVALLLDDLHWSDPASLDLLRFLARSVSGLSLLVLITYRSDELTRRHPLYPLLPQLAREASADRIDLGRLDDIAVRTLLHGRYSLPETDTDRLAAYLQTRAEGNALFIGELLRSLEEAGALEADRDGWRLGDLAGVAVPTLLRQVIDGRLGRLDERAQHLLAIAAVIGQEVPLDLWAGVAASEEEAVLAAAEQGLDGYLLVEAPNGEGVRFAHALIREALYEGVPAIRRRRVHRRVGEVLAGDSHADPDAVAYHFQRADDERALPWQLKAGERAQAAYAWATAAARFAAALALMAQQGADAGERGWLLLRRSHLLRYVAVVQARACADEAVRLARAANDGALAAYARFQCGQLACLAGDVAGGLPELEAGAAVMTTLTDAERAHFAARAAAIDAPLRLPEGRGTAVLWQASAGHYDAARALGERLVAETAGNEEMLQAVKDGYYGLGIAYAALGRPDEATAMFARARDTYLREGHHALASQTARHELAVVALPYRTEDIAGRRRLAEQAEIEHERASGAVPATIPPRSLRLPLLVVEGEWEEAERLTLAGSAETQGHSAYRTRALGYLATLARLRGDAERARWAVREELPASGATEPGTIWPFEFATAAQRVAAALALDAGDLPTAKEWLDAHDRWLAWSSSLLGRSEGHALWAQYHRQAGDMDKAYEHAARALALASEPRQPLALLAARRLLGELDTEAGRFNDAEKHLDASLALADACAAPYERALTLLAMAEMRTATDETDAARMLVDTVVAICGPLGARPALARAERLAVRLKRA